MSKPGTQSEVVLALAEEFVARYRKGERPSLREYIDHHPELATEIREVFPAMALMENIALVQEEESTPAPAAPEPLPLQQLGDYRLIRAVGHGGMGIVYEAEQVSLGRHVALKLLPRKMLTDSKHRRRFEREARLAAKLHHTNIVPVFGVGEQDGLPYYVMQFIQGLGLDQVLEELKRLRAAGEGNIPAAKAETPAGKDLSAADMARSLLTGQFQPVLPDSSVDPSPAEEPAGCAREKPVAASSAGHLVKSLSDSSVVLPGQSGPSGQRKAKPPSYWQSVAQIGVQVAQALEYAHQQGVLHRDIKPSNLLLDRRTTVWVTDFGLAKASDSDDLTHTGDALGTLRYMPPEAFEGHSDARSDLYSLGLTLYELLAFRPAFDEKDRNRLIKQVTTSEPPRLDRLNPEVPRDLVTIVHKTIDRDPRQRYATGGELAADLQRFTDDEPIKARPISAAERLARWCRRNPLLASALSAVAATLILGTVAAWLLAAWAFQEAERARRQAYTATIRLMPPAWEGRDLSQLQDLLDETAAFPERGFEWYYWQRLCHAEHLTLVGHIGGVTSVAFAPDGQRLATGGKDGTARIWNATNGEQLSCLRDHASEVTGVAFTPDGQGLVSGSTDGTAKLWELSHGRVLRTLPGGNSGSVWAVTMTLDGKRVITGYEDGTARVWDVARDQVLLTLDGHQALPAIAACTLGFLSSPGAPRPLLAASTLYPGRTQHPRAIWAVAVTPDQKRLITAGQDDLIMIWDASTGRQLRSFQGKFDGDPGINSVSVSPDGKRLLSVGYDSVARLWDADTGTQLSILSRNASWGMAFAVSPDEQRLVTTYAGGVKIWDMVSLPDIGVSTLGLLSSPQAPGPLLAASALYRGRTNTVGGRELLTLLGHRDGVTGVAVSPDRQRLAMANANGTARVWEMASGGGSRPLKAHTGPVQSVAVTPDGKQIITGSDDGTAKVWDTTSGRQLLELKGHLGAVAAVTVTPDGQRIITGGVDGTARIWDAVSGRELRKLEWGSGEIRSVAMTPDGRRLVTGGWGAAQFWDLTSGERLLPLKLHLAMVMSVAVTPDGQRVVTGTWHGGMTRVWDITTGKELLKFQETPEVALTSVVVAPRSQRLLAARGDGRVTVWDMTSGRELFFLKGHRDPVWSVTVTADEQRIITGGADGTVRVWDAVSGRELLVLNGHAGPVYSVAVTPDGRQLIAGCSDGTVQIWEAASQEETDRWTQQEQEVKRRGVEWGHPGPKARGFIQDWLVLAPLKLKDDQISAKGLEPQQVAGEANLHPRAGEHVRVDGQEYTWQEYHEGKPVLNLNRTVGDGRDYCLAYAVCYVISAAERHDLWLQVSCAEQAKVYLNGQRVYQYTRWGTAALEPAGPVTLRKGMNVLIVKVVKDRTNWNVFARFVDRESNPAEGVRVSLTPE